MPELPEVETVCWRLREGGHGEAPLVGSVIVDVTVPDPSVVVGDAALFIDTLRGARVRHVWRRAKWIVIDVDDAGGMKRTILVHLRMTGDLHVYDVGVEVRRAPRWEARLTDGRRLCFTDPRRFGHVEVLAPGDDPATRFLALGPEPLDDDFTARALKARLTGRRPLKVTLLDQSVVAGLGNIYSDESLWLARLHPQTPTNTLSDDDIVGLRRSIRRALRESIVACRQDVAWRYEHRAETSPFRVYDRDGGPCLRCGTTLQGSTVAGRTTVICPACQTLP